MSITLKEMKQRLSNKYCVFPMLYNYKYLNETEIPCIFYEIGENDNETDESAKIAEDTLITMFGRDDFQALGIISPFMEWDQSVSIQKAITEKWRVKVADYILNYLSTEQYIKNGYFFMFIPKSI